MERMNELEASARMLFFIAFFSQRADANLYALTVCLVLRQIKSKTVNDKVTSFSRRFVYNQGSLSSIILKEE